MSMVFREVPIVASSDVTALPENMRIRLAVESILAGNTQGRLWRAGPTQRPALELLWDMGNNVLFVSAAEPTEAGQAAVREFVGGRFAEEARAARAPFFAVVATGEAAKPLVDAAASPFSPRPARKLVCALEAVAGPPTSDQVQPFRVVPIDRAFFEGNEVSGTAPVREEVEWMWASISTFYESGFGFAGVSDGATASWCTAEYVGSRACGIGIETVEEHRRKGIAYAVARRFLAECRLRRLVPYWECDSQNQPSVALAEKLGFRPVQTIDAVYCRLV